LLEEELIICSAHMREKLEREREREREGDGWEEVATR